MKTIREHEFYLPTNRNDGTPVAQEIITQIKQTLMLSFGGYTHLQHRTEGVWRMGGVTFQDEVTLVRVLDVGTSDFDLGAFKTLLEAALDQESVLIVSRDVEIA